MSKFIIIPILIFHTIFLSAQSDWKILKESKYSIKYPKDWKLQNPGQMGSEFMIFSPISEPGDKFRENINLLIQNLNGLNLNLEQYTELSENQIKTLISDSKIFENKRQHGKKYDYQKIIYKGTMGELKLKFVQYYWVINNKAYVLTFTAEQNQFDKYLPVAVKIMDSFEIRN